MPICSISVFHSQAARFRFIVTHVCMGIRSCLRQNVYKGWQYRRMVVYHHKFYDCDFFHWYTHNIIMKHFLLLIFMCVCMFAFVCHLYRGFGAWIFVCKSLRSFNKFGLKSSANNTSRFNTNTWAAVQKFGQKWFTCIECRSRNMADIFTRCTRRAIRSHCEAGIW